VEVSGGETPFYGYLAVPEGRGPYAAVVLVPGAADPAPPVRALARRSAAEGFAALAVDLAADADESSSDRGSARGSTLPAAAGQADVLDRIEAARRLLASFDDVRAEAIALMGYENGATHVLHAARTATPPAACVVWCPDPPVLGGQGEGATVLAASTSRLACPHLVLLGDRQRTAIGSFRRLIEGLPEPERMRLHSYAGADAGFYDDSRADRYQPQAASEAWMEAVTFLRRWLG